MNVLMACTELTPLVRVGGMADAVAALARTLSRLDHKVTIALPRHPAIDETNLMLARRLTPIRFTVGDTEHRAMLFDARLGAGVDLMLIDLPDVFTTDAIYGADDGRRYGLYCRALTELVKARERAGTPFDVVHAHNWPTALLPYLLRRQREEVAVRTVLTVHDGRDTGRFDKAVIDEVGLSWDDFHPSALEFYGDVCFLKVGLLSADAVTSVAPSYVSELKGGADEGTLAGVYKSRQADFTGILDGVDYGRWSPATDPHITARYDAEEVANKGRCKAALLNEFDLSLDPERPLLAHLGPLGREAGSDLVAAALGDIVRAGARVVVAGEGDPEVVASLHDACEGLEDDAVVIDDPSTTMLHRVVSAADGLLQPARFDPGARWPQIGQRYGAAPVAVAVPGMVDAVVDCDAQCETGTGFLAGEADADAIAGAVGRAVGVMRSSRWGALRRRIMRLDRSWESPARRYARLYQG